MAAPFDGKVDAGDSRIQVRLPTAFAPPVSKITLIDWAPGFSWTRVDTVVQDCHPPVFGMLSALVASMPPNSTWKVPPWPSEATLASSRYWPAEATATL